MSKKMSSRENRIPEVYRNTPHVTKETTGGANLITAVIKVAIACNGHYENRAKMMREAQVSAT
jgi:hypothetical protein